MSATFPLWDDLAALADYPRDATYLDRASHCAGQAAAAKAPAAAALAQFRDRIASCSIGLIQERYVAAFDFDPTCAPEIGWHLFSDGPDRAPWLAALRDELARAGIDENGELPDHLAHLLRLIPRAQDARARQLAAQILPVVQQIRERLAARDHEFTTLLAAAAALLRTRLEGAGGAP